MKGRKDNSARVPIERRLASLAVAAVFLLTSCPAPMAGPEDAVSTLPFGEDTGRIRWCSIGQDGEFTDDTSAAYGRLYWVEKDGKVQPGRVSVGRRDNMVNVVNFVDTDSGNRFRLFFMDRANLPYRLVVECGDGSGGMRTLVGSEVRYDQEEQEVSLRLADRDGGSVAELSGVRLNSELFGLDQPVIVGGGSPAGVHLGLSYEQYLVTVSACLLYAMGGSGVSWSEDGAALVRPQMSGRWGWSDLFGALAVAFTGVAVVTFVVAAVLAPAVVVPGASVLAVVSASNAGWAVASAVSAAVAVASAAASAVSTAPEPEVYVDTRPEYGGGTQEEPPRIAVWQVDAAGSPENPGPDGWFTNGGIVHLHHQDQTVTERHLCLQWLGGTRPVSLEFGQSTFSSLAHTAMLLRDLSAREKIFEPNTQSVLSPVPDRFYLSIERKSDIRGSNPKEFYTFVVFNPKSDDMVVLVNGEEGLSTQLEDGSQTLTEETRYKNIFKVNVCTDELYCPDKN